MRRALFVYLRMACFEVWQYGSLNKTSVDQLKLASSLHLCFGLEHRVLFDMLNIPNRLIVVVQYLKRRGITFDAATNTPSSTQDMSRFLAVFTPAKEGPDTNAKFTSSMTGLDRSLEYHHPRNHHFPPPDNEDMP